MNGKNLKSVIAQNISVIIFIFILNVILIIPSVLSPIFKKVFIDYILTDDNETLLFMLLALMIAVAFLSGITNWIKKNCLMRLSDKIEISGISKYMWLMINAPMSVFDKKDEYSLISQSENSKYISNALTRDFVELLFNSSSVIFYLFFMIRMDAVMTLIVLGLIIFNFAMVGLKDFITDKLKRNNNGTSLYELTTQDERIGETGLSNIEMFKSTASEDTFLKRIIGSKMGIINARKARDLEESYSPLDDLSQVIFINLFLLVSAFRIMNRDLSIGDYLAFQAYAVAFFYPMIEVLTAKDTIYDLKRNIARLYSGFKEFGENNEYPENSEVRLNGDIEFCNVTFGYDENLPVIKDFNLSVKSGQKVAIIGKTGAGKTTVLKLLQGMYKPNKGNITVDGVNVTDFDNRCLMKNLGFAAQNISFFSDTVRNNITLWDEKVTDLEIHKATSDACIYDYISSLDGAFDYEIKENGGNLSGGQRQRIEISRAFLYNPPIILFDEATASIDADNRTEIRNNILNRGCTFITVTHLLENMTDYDEIIILDKGKVISRGTHGYLLQESEYYNSLFNAENKMYCN